MAVKRTLNDSSVARRKEEIKKSVRHLYMNYPYPQWTKEERHFEFNSELCRYRFLGLEEAMRGARFIEVGCGTGNRSMLAAQHFGVKEFVGLDISSVSLEIAQKVAKEEGFDRFTPIEGDLFNIPYPDGSFDVVVSWGVLHHTHDPFAGLKEMVRLCRPGGYVGIFLYNKWNHWRHNMQKAKVSRLAGPDIERRFDVAHRLYGEKPVEEMSPYEISLFYDQYCHPHKSDHTVGETLSWFDQLGLTYWGSYPPLRLRDYLSFYQWYRGTLIAEHLPRRRYRRLVLAMLLRLPSTGKAGPPFNTPTLLHRSLWGLWWMWLGRHGVYSGGSSLSARKEHY